MQFLLALTDFCLCFPLLATKVGVHMTTITLHGRSLKKSPLQPSSQAELLSHRGFYFLPVLSTRQPQTTQSSFFFQSFFLNIFKLVTMDLKEVELLLHHTVYWEHFYIQYLSMQRFL